jgi:signal transduction histidine kinase
MHRTSSEVRCRLFETALVHQRGIDWPAVARTVLDEELSMERLIDELLMLARADAGALIDDRTIVDVATLALREVDHIEPRRGMTVDVSAGSSAPVMGVPDQLARVIRNLVGNAQLHAASRIAVEVAVVGGDAVVIVADDGPGIPLSQRERVFDRFTRLDEARSRRSGGVGLGLSIAKEIVGAHGGTIAVADAANGARLVIRLPLAREGEPQAQARRRA